MKRILLVVVGLLSLTSISADIPASGDVVRIGDLDFVIVSRADYERLSSSVADIQARWAYAHSNEQGRVAFHGTRKHTTITNGYVEVEYSDGYKHREAARPNATKRTIHAQAETYTPPKPVNLPPALSRLLNDRKQHRTVTVEMGAK